MSYGILAYYAVFLPIVLLVYQLMPKKYRFIALLAANVTFFCLISKWLIVYLIAASVLTYYVALWIEKIKDSNLDSKIKTGKAKRALALGIIANLLVIIVLKYTNFLGGVVCDVIHIFNKNVTFSPIHFLVPIGMSFYTLEIIAYLTDVYRGTQKAQHNFIKVFLCVSFFPQIMEGPIARFSQTGDALYEGKKITFDNLKLGYQRILWGLFKKLIIADRLNSAVNQIFDNYNKMPGSIIVLGAILFTTQLYNEFSGAMDIILGSGQILGINLPENFRQPFFAKSASEFWRRWHITLGTFFKDYIFYPVSLAKPVKKLAKKVKKRCGKSVGKFVAPAIALFCVWICNGLWHGANWNFIFYGMYYFVIILIENITEEPIKKLTAKLHINTKSFFYNSFRTVKLFIIVIVGEMFYNATTLKDGFLMFKRIFTDFQASRFVSYIGKLRIAKNDLAICFIGVIIVTIVGVIHEKNISVRDKVAQWKLPVRWLFWYGIMLFVIIFGAYGSGYAVVDLIYAGY